jgi:hypothetical protein
MWPQVAVKGCCCTQEEEGAVARDGLHTVADAVVPDSWHKTVSDFVEFTGVLLPPSLNGDLT